MSESIGNYFRKSISRNATHPQSHNLIQIETVGLRLQDWGCVVWRKIDFLLNICHWIHLFATVLETSYLNTDMCKFESSHEGESRALSADSAKAYSKHRPFNCNSLWSVFFHWDRWPPQQRFLITIFIEGWLIVLKTPPSSVEISQQRCKTGFDTI